MSGPSFHLLDSGTTVECSVYVSMNAEAMVLTFGGHLGGAHSLCSGRRGALPGLCANGREGSCHCLCSGARLLCFLTVQQVMVAHACKQQMTQPEAKMLT